MRLFIRHVVIFFSSLLHSFDAVFFSNNFSIASVRPATFNLTSLHSLLQQNVSLDASASHRKPAAVSINNLEKILYKKEAVACSASPQRRMKKKK